MKRSSTLKRVTLCLPVLAIACGGTAEKKKGAFEGELATTYSAASAGFTEIAEPTVQSPHPYTNNLRRTWTVQGSRDAVKLKIVFERFELENGYDFLTVSGEPGNTTTRHTGTKTGQEIVLNGNKATFQLVTDYSVTGWGFRIKVLEKTVCACPEILQPVCGANGQTYSNACEAGCASVDVRHSGQCSTNWFPVARNLQSVHPYANDFTNTWTIREGGASVIRAHFTRVDTEQGYDFVRILDGNDRVVAEYTGKHTDLTTPTVQGDTLKVQLVTDYSVTRFGFSLDKYEVQGGCNSDAECGAGNVCTQPQCIRAPCFAVCAPAGGNTYRSVTVDQLNDAPARFDGRRVRVTAEPTVLARCTRRGCTQANACCNTCSGGFVIDGISLKDANGRGYSCSGNECNWERSCDPFPVANNGGDYVLEGTFETNGASKILKVDRFRAASCAASGCSGQACGNTAVNTTCDFRPEYACYRNATCTAQSDGFCGWTQTSALRMCIDDARGGNAGPTTVTSSDTPLSIPDNTQAGVTSTVNVSGQGTVGTAKVSATITHTYRGDLRVTLIAPDGTEAVLADRTGGSRDNLTLNAVEVPTMAGLARAGTWSLRVQDTARADTGRLVTWSLTIE